MSWEDARKGDAEDRQKQGVFLKIEVGTSALLAFRGEPKRHEIVFIDGKGYDYDPTEHEGLDVIAKYKWNVYNFTDGKAQLADITPAIFRFLDKEEKKGRLYKNTYELSRVKAKGPGTWEITREDPITEQQEEILAKAQMFDLDRRGTTTAPPPPSSDTVDERNPPPPDEDEDLPF